MDGLSTSDIQRLATVLEQLSEYDGTWHTSVRKVVVVVNGTRVTLSRRNKYASLRVSKVEAPR